MKPILQIKINAINNSVLNLYVFFLSNVFKKLNVQYALTSLPTKKKRITVLKSPHVHKSSREQFEIKTYKLVFTIFSNFSESFLNFLILNKPKSLKVKIKAL